MKDKNKALILFGNLDIIIAGAALVALVVLTFLGVFMRYALGRPFTWLEEVQLWCMVWIVYVSAGAAFRTGNHVAIEMLVDMFPKKVQKIIDILIALTVYVVLIFLLIQSVGFVQLFLRNGRSTNMLEIPYAVIYGIIPVAIVSMVVSYTISTYHQMKDLDADKIQEEDRL